MVVLLTALSLCACLPIYVPKRVAAPLDQPSVVADSKERVKVGDKVTVYTRKGKTQQFEVTSLEVDGFVGVAWDNKKYRVKYADLNNMWVNRWGWHLLDLFGGPH